MRSFDTLCSVYTGMLGFYPVKCFRGVGAGMSGIEGAAEEHSDLVLGSAEPVEKKIEKMDALSSSTFDRSPVNVISRTNATQRIGAKKTLWGDSQNIWLGALNVNKSESLTLSQPFSL